MKYILTILILITALPARAGDLNPVTWTHKDTGVEWKVASYHIQQFPRRNIEGKYLILAIRAADWEAANPDKKAKIKLVIHRLLSGIEELTAANIAAAKAYFADNNIRFMVVDDAFQALWDAGLRPPTPEV